MCHKFTAHHSSTDQSEILNTKVKNDEIIFITCN